MQRFTDTAHAQDFVHAESMAFLIETFCLKVAQG